MRPETRALKLLQAGNLPAQYALLSKPRKAYARELVASGYTARVAIQQAYIFSPSQARKAKRHYYAIGYAYIRAISNDDILMRFDSVQDRNAYCEARNTNGFEGEWEPVTLASIRHRFDVSKFETDYQELYAGTDKAKRYIYQRPGYII